MNEQDNGSTSGKMKRSLPPTICLILLFPASIAVFYPFVAPAHPLLPGHLFGSTAPQTSFRFEYLTPEDIAQHDDNRTLHIKNFNRLFIDDYMAWHRASRRRAENSFADGGPRRGAPVKTLVVRLEQSLTHGIGDRMRAILHAYICAVLSRRLLLIEWQHPFPLSTVFVGGYGANFTYDADIFATELLPNGSENSVVAPGSYFHALNKHNASIQTVNFVGVAGPSLPNLFQRAPVMYPGNDVARKLSKMEELRPFEAYPLIMNALFKPSPRFREVLSQNLAKRKSLFGNRLRSNATSNIHVDEPYVSIQARLGYGIGEIRTAGGRFRLENYGLTMQSIAECFAARALKLAEEKGMSKSPLFYLATDTPLFREQLMIVLKKKNRNSRLMFGTWDVKHVRDLHIDVPGDLERYMYTFMDIFLLSSGEGLLHLRSGFADLAIWMGGIRDSVLMRYEECATH